MKTIKVLTVIFLFMTLFSAPVLAEELLTAPSPFMKIFDLVIIRPISIGVAAASTGLYLGTAPLTFPAGVSENAARVLVEAPWRFTNARCLGDFSRYRDGKPITNACEECP